MTATVVAAFWSLMSGTVAVMEVRALDAPFMVEDGQRFCKLQLERMASVPDKLYGTQLGSSYQSQGLTPSKHFRAPKPEEIKKQYYDPQYLLFPDLHPQVAEEAKRERTRNPRRTVLD